MKPLFLRLHRWITLAFAVPLAVIIVTGLVLSFEPIAYDRHVTGKTVPLATMEAVLAKHDPERKAGLVSVRAYENVVVLAEGRGAGAQKRIDLTTNEVVPAGKTLWSDVLLTSRRLHETLLLDLRWLVTASTIAMTVSIFFGILLGWPFLRNSLGGWHRVTAWSLLPLLVLSPLTGLAIAWGLTFTPPPARVEGPPVPLHEAVRLVGAAHDLASVVWIRPQGGAMRARIYDGREAKVFAVTRSGLVGGPQNWPRALHEGVWGGLWSGLVNVVTSIGLVLLMTTGMLIWVRRTFRKRPQRQRQAASA